MTGRTFLAALAGLCLAGAAAAYSQTSGSDHRVIDGDTLEVAGRRIRLWGIDAPERGQTCEGRGGRTYECGRDAAAVLSELVRGKRVSCAARDHDRYGRIVAVCSTEAGEINAAMVRRGWAVVYRRYARGAYETEEAAARADGIGIWSGRFTLPEDYRRTKAGLTPNPR